MISDHYPEYAMSLVGSEHWNLAQAVTWVCTRDPGAVARLKGQSSANVLKVQLAKYASRKTFNVRIRLKGAPLQTDTSPRLILNAADALRSLNIWAQSGGMEIGAKDCAKNRVTVAKNLHGLVLLVPPYSPSDEMGFWSEEEGCWKWVDITFRAEHVMQFAPTVSGKVSAGRFIRRDLEEYLKDQAEDGKLKRKNALARCMANVPGCYREAFRDAWKRLPAKLKVPAGRPKSDKKVRKKLST